MSDDGALHEAFASQVGRVGERLVKVETAQEYLKRDTEAIRNSQHTLANEMQKLVASESKMVGQMEALALAQTNAHLATEKLAKSVDTLNEARMVQSGGWQMAVRIASIVVACISMIGGVLAAIIHVTGIMRQ